MSEHFWLTEAQMDRLRPFFPRSRGKPRVDDRRVLSGIIYVKKNGLQWKDAPGVYGVSVRHRGLLLPRLPPFGEFKDLELMHVGVWH